MAINEQNDPEEAPLEEEEEEEEGEQGNENPVGSGKSQD